MFQIDRCKNTTEQPDLCGTDDEIDDYVRDMSVEGWAQYQVLDFTSFGEQPTFKE